MSGRPLNQCDKCGGTNTTLMFIDYICNVCEPAKGAPAHIAQTKDTSNLKRGWVIVPHDTLSADTFVIKRVNVYVSCKVARHHGGCMYDSEVKEVYIDARASGTKYYYTLLYVLVDNDENEKYWFEEKHNVARLVEPV